LAPNTEMKSVAVTKKLSGSTTATQRGGKVIPKRPKPIDKPAWDIAREMLLNVARFG
jgi:hypothetical protein